MSASRPGRPAPTASARAMPRVRDAALAGAVPPSTPRPVIRASWHRVRAVGLDPSAAPEVPLLGLGELQRRRATSGLEPLLPLLRARLGPAADAAGQLLVLVDAEGRVLWREGSLGVRRRADALGFVEGSAWDEASVGTNAIGTSLVVGGPLAVHAAEHYADSHQPWTCAAAPLRDPVTGDLLGAVDVSGPAATVHASTVALVDAVARLAELELRAAHEARLDRLRALAAPLLARLTSPALVVGSDGATAAATGVVVPARLALPDRMSAGPVWLPSLGHGTAEPLPGGWLVRLDDGAPAPAAEPTGLVLDLSGDPPRVRVAGRSGSWTCVLSPRHAELLLALVRAPGGRSAAELSDDLFADPARTVTVRAEVSRLRRTLGPLLQHRPYRLADGVDARLRLPPDPREALPRSSAPVAARLRALPGAAGRSAG